MQGGRPVIYQPDDEFALVSFIVPSQVMAEQLRSDYEQEQDFKIQLYSQVMDEYLAEAYRCSFDWKVRIL